MESKEKLKQLINRSGLKHTTILFNNFTKDLDFYYYPVEVCKTEFYNSQDRLSTDYVCKKIQKFNKLAEKEITYANITMSHPIAINSSDEIINLRLRVRFNR